MNNPRHESFVFHDKRAAYVLVIGVLNEGQKFARQIESLQKFRKDIDIIIADGGSSDGATAADKMQSMVRTLLINRDEQRGLSVQYRIALAYAMEEGYEGVIMMDGNGKDGVEAIDMFIARLKEGFDFVQGSRFMKGGRHENTPIGRLLGIRFVFNPIMNLACGYYYTDGMNGFKACSRNFMCDARVQPFRDVFVRYNLQYYLNYIAPRIGMKIVQIPVSRSYHDENSPHTKIVGIRAYVSILRELMFTVMGHYNPE